MVNKFIVADQTGWVVLYQKLVSPGETIAKIGKGIGYKYFVYSEGLKKYV